MVSTGSLAIVEQEVFDGEIVRGETIRFIKEFDLFGCDINGLTGIIVRVDSGLGKPLVVVESTGEWIEPAPDMYERIAPGIVTESAQEFIGCVVKLGEN